MPEPRVKPGVPLAPLTIAPAKVLAVPLLTVSIGDPAALLVMTPPVPLRVPTVALLLLRSSAPLLMVRLEVAAPSALLLPACNVPAEMVVPPV